VDLAFLRKKPAHRLGALDEIDCITVKAELMHLQGCVAVIRHRYVMETCAYFFWGHRGWHDVRLVRTEPCRYTGLLSQGLRCVTHKSVKESVIVVALGNKRL